MQPTVFLVDDDAAVRASLVRLIESRGLPAIACANAEALLAACGPDAAGCVVLDLHLPGGMNGLEVQTALRARGVALPVIFLSGRGSIASTALAMKAGAVDFLEKPVPGRTLLARIEEALQDDARRRARAGRRQQVEARLATLTAREHEVLSLTLSGMSNKQIAPRLGISYRTVEIHRSRAMQKMGAGNLFALARLLAPEPGGDPMLPETQ